MGRAKIPATPLEIEILKTLSDLLRRRGISETELAKKAEITQSTVYRILNGKNALSFTYFVRMCNALNIRVSAVIREAEENLSAVTDTLQPDEYTLIASTHKLEDAPDSP